MNEPKRLTPTGAAKLFCQLKCKMTANEVSKCNEIFDMETKTGCPLHSFRKGHNPNRKGIRQNTSTIERERKSGKFIPSQHGEKRIIHAIPDVLTIDGIKYRKEI